MNDESIPQELNNYRRYVLNTMWGGAMHWFAASRGDIEIDSHMPPRELQDARKMGEMYFDRFEKEAEKLLAYLQSTGDIQISGPEESILKTRRKSARHAINREEHQDSVHRLRKSIKAAPLYARLRTVRTAIIAAADAARADRSRIEAVLARTKKLLRQGCAP